MVTIEEVEIFLQKNCEEAKKHKRENQELEHKRMSKGYASQTPVKSE
jgi:hypothetical protein